MTFATLRALQAIIGDAIDEIYAAYASENRPHSGSLNPNFISLSPSLSTSSSTSSSSTPPPSPKQHRSPTPPLLSLSDQTLSSASHYSQSQSSGNPVHPSDHHPLLDFPDLNLPGDPSSPAEQLTSRPDIANAISRIVAAASQLAIVARSPFLTICDATMIVCPMFSYLLFSRLLEPFQKYHLPSCLRFFEASHIPELLSAAGPAGLSVIEISASVGVDSVKISMSSRVCTSFVLFESIQVMYYGYLPRIILSENANQTFSRLIVSPLSWTLDDHLLSVDLREPPFLLCP